MTYTATQPKPFYAAVVTRLGDETGKQIGKAKAPEDVTTPYAVVYPQPDGASDGTLDDPDSDVWQVFQVTCVGADMDEAQWMQGKVRTALLGWKPIVSGLAASKVELDSGSGVTQDPEVKTLFYTTDRFRCFTSPT